MENNKFDDMLALVAKAYNATPEIIREKIALAITQGQESSDPQVRALWASVPHTGSVLTLSDFIAYLAKTLQEPYGS